MTECKRGFDTEVTNQPAKAEVGTYYLFVIAVNDYDNSLEGSKFRNLPNPVRDAAGVTELLIKKYKFDVPAGIEHRELDEDIIEYNSLTVKCLYNQQATRANILTHLRKLSEVITKTDCLLIYFAGHGMDIGDESSGYFIPHDGIDDLDDTSHWLGFEKLYQRFKYPDNVFQPLKCMDLLLILDCCFAGTINLGMQDRKDSWFSRYALVSSSPHELADDGQSGEGSLFANTLIQELTNNNYAQSHIDFTSLNQRFKLTYEVNYGEAPTQQMQYGSLPPANGYGQFTFELRDPDTPPVEHLADTIINSLNFGSQKTDFFECWEYPFSDEFAIIAAISGGQNLHKLQTKVLLYRLKRLIKKDIHLSTFITISPYHLEKKNEWECLAIELGVPAGDNYEEQCIKVLCERLVRDLPAVGASDVANILYLNYAHTADASSTSMFAFYRDFYERFTKVKAGYNIRRLYLFSTTENYNAQLEARKEFCAYMEGHEINFVVTKAVTPLNFSNALDWHNEAKQHISSSRLQNLDLTRIIKGNSKVEITKFIKDMADFLGTKDVIKYLWDFQ